MNTKQLAEFLGKHYTTITRICPKLGIILKNGTKTIFNNEEIEKICTFFGKNSPMHDLCVNKITSTRARHDLDSVKLNSDLDIVKVMTEINKNLISDLLKQLIPIIDNRNKIDFIQDYYSILGYCNLKNIKLTFSEAQRLGKKAAELSQISSIEVKKVQDERFGYVGSYHISILEKVFEV